MKIGAADDLEHIYMAKFQAFAANYGNFVKYDADRAARDIGLHFTQSSPGGGRVVNPALVWFQMKGVSAGKLPLERFEAAETVSISLQTNHLRFWYVSPENTYLVLYIESADQFLVINIKEWVTEQLGEAVLTATQQTYTVTVDKKNVLDDHAFRVILRNNLVSVVRARLKDADDAEARRFLAASEVVKWVDQSRQAGAQIALAVKAWISKTRTEVAFLSRASSADDWEIVRVHWQFSMPPLTTVFPFLTISGGRLARFEVEVIEDDYDYDGEPIYETRRSIEWLDPEVAEEMDYEELEGEGWLDLGGELYAYGDVAGYEYAEHQFTIELNELGEAWLETLKVMEAAEILVVGSAEAWVSVAPWHARDL